LRIHHTMSIKVMCLQQNLCYGNFGYHIINVEPLKWQHNGLYHYLKMTPSQILCTQITGCHTSEDHNLSTSSSWCSDQLSSVHLLQSRNNHSSWQFLIFLHKSSDTMKISDFWDVMLCSWFDPENASSMFFQNTGMCTYTGYVRFAVLPAMTYVEYDLLCLTPRSMERAEHFNGTYQHYTCFCWYLTWLTQWLWIWQQYVTLKCWAHS
jgi:hypothetical protein